MTEMPSIAAAGVAVTVAVFAAAAAVQRRTGWALLNPVLVSVAVIAGMLLVLHIPHARYEVGGRLLGLLLGPAVVALAVPLHQQTPRLLARGRSIGVSLLVGSAIGILSGLGVGALLQVPEGVLRSIVPRSVTTPIAMGIAERIGGIPSLTALLVIVSGITGAVLGPGVLKVAGVRSRTALGLALGAAAHGIGAARAAEEGVPEAASAGLAMALMGLLTALWAPLLLWLLSSLGVL
ncbi:MAG: LrgB family protein [Gemmatimonadota bacterium]